jgi:hypothetical protein
MTILDAIKEIQYAMIHVKGINTAPDYPGSGIFPIVLTHLGNGNITPGNPAGARLELHNIVVELHVAESGGMADAFASLEALHALIVPELCSDTTFSSTIQTYSNISYSTTASSWDGVPTRARMYTLNNCKIIV